MFTIDDIDLNVDYDNLTFIESQLMHEVKSKGKEEFVREYSNNLEEMKEQLNYTEFCFLLALLEYFDGSFDYDRRYRTEKYVANARDFLGIELYNDASRVFKTYEKALPCFLNRGFIYDGVEEAI